MSVDDVVNDGEYGHAMTEKVDYGGWWFYSFERFSGLELLHELHAQGTTIIVITHDNELAAQLPRQIAIRDGRIVGDSSQKEIVHDDVYAPA